MNAYADTLDAVVEPSMLLDARYRLVKVIAQGGMGVVYEGLQLSIDRPVAIKVIRDELVHDKSTAKRFLREVRLLSKFRHPNVVELFDYGQTPEGCPYLVMELLRGQTLDALVAETGRLDVWRACEIARQLCDVLAAAHERGIVHRDLKPANVIVLDDLGIIKVLDFGIAKSFVPDYDDSESITHVGMMIGTPLYMAPESIGGDTDDPRSDLYSLGCILHELLGGVATFSSPTIGQTLALQIDAPPPPLPDDVPRALSDLVFELLAKSPDERPATARIVRDRIANFVAVEPVQCAPTIADPPPVAIDELPTVIEQASSQTQMLTVEAPPSPLRVLAVFVAIAVVLALVVAFVVP